MHLSRRHILIETATILLFLTAIQSPNIWAAPIVTNITATQRTDGSGLVDIAFDLADGIEPITISIHASNDNGAT